MTWQPIDVATVPTFRRSSAWRYGNRALVAVVAFSPAQWSLGFEVIYRTANGLALLIGPLFLALALSKPHPAPPQESE